MLTHRRTLAAAAATAAVLALTSCAGSAGQGAADGPVSLDFWYSASGVPADVLVSLVDDFNTKYDDRITVNAIYQGAYDESMAKLTTAVQGGRLPGIVQGGDTFSTYLKDTGITVSPSKVADIDGHTFTGDDLVPVVRNYYTFDDELSSIPIMVSQLVVVYNKALLAKAGIDPATPPKNLRELFDLAQTAHAATGTGGITQFTDPWWAEQYSASEGLTYCTPHNGVGKEPATGFNYTNAEQVELWTAVQSAVASGVLPNTGTDGNASLNLFNSGGAAFMMQSSRIYGDVLKAGTVDFGIWPFPVGDSAGGAVPGGNSVWLIKEGKTDAELAAAATFARYLASADAQTAIFQQTGYLPTSQDSLTELAGSVDPIQQVMLDQFKDTNSSDASAGCHTGAMGEARTTVKEALEQIIGGADVTQSLQRAQKAGDAAITSYNSRS